MDRRHIIEKGVGFITEEEGGCVLHSYSDQAGIPTIYVGHRILPGETFNNTLEEGMAYLRKDLAVAEAAVERYVKVPLTDTQFAALVSFVFNVGEGNFLRSTLLRRLNLNDFAGAANEFRLWIHSNGKVITDLILRRAREKALFEEA